MYNRKVGQISVLYLGAGSGSGSELDRAGLDWIGLDWIEMGHVMLCHGLDWVRFGGANKHR